MGPVDEEQNLFERLTLSDFKMFLSIKDFQ